MVGTRRSASQALTPGLDMDTPRRRVTSTTATVAPTSNGNKPTSSNGKSTPARSSPHVSSIIEPVTTTRKPWSHAPTTTTLLWLALSLPLVAWDTAYVLGRPATMPGGWAHSPFWTPYALYGEVDGMYGRKQWDRGNGFTAAQAALNVVETFMYLAYVVVWYRASAVAAKGLKAGLKVDGLKEGLVNEERRRIAGRAGAIAVVLGLSASVMTVSKTALYWLVEYFSGYENIGHNTPWDLLLLWIIPNGAWLVVPSYMIYQLGSEIIDAITIASIATRSTTTEDN